MRLFSTKVSLSNTPAIKNGKHQILHKLEKEGFLLLREALERSTYSVWRVTSHLKDEVWALVVSFYLSIA
jgi:hypothetical protein